MPCSSGSAPERLHVTTACVCLDIVATIYRDRCDGDEFACLDMATTMTRGLKSASAACGRGLRDGCDHAEKSASAPSVRSVACRGFDVERGHAAQLASILRIVERASAMHGRAVVPDHQVARPPA